MKLRFKQKSREQRNEESKARKAYNEEEPPIAEDVELLIDHTVWTDEKSRSTYAQGPLYQVVSNKKLTRDNTGPNTGPEKDDQEDSGKVNLFRIGNKVHFCAPAYIGTGFMQQGRYHETTEGRKRFGYFMGMLLGISYAFLFYYLPQSSSVNETELFTGRIALIIYTAAIMTLFFLKWYNKKTTAYRIRMHCFDTSSCDLNDVHVGTFVVSKYPLKDQISWWYSKDIPDAFATLNQQIIKKNKEIQKLILTGRIERDAAIKGARIEAHEYFADHGWLWTNEPWIQHLKYLSIGLCMVVVVLITYIATGGGK